MEPIIMGLVTFESSYFSKVQNIVERPRVTTILRADKKILTQKKTEI
jgi:hypothetical protein